MRHLRGLVPNPVKSIYRSLRKKAIVLFYYGHRVFCPCCKKSFSKFRPYGIIKRPNARCPNCDALERHRLQMLFLARKTTIFEEASKILHFAPEACFFQRFDSLPYIQYTPVDVEPTFYPNGTIKAEITNLAFQDNSFDVIICNHVLEHISDDRKALQELFRVLKPGGWAILQVPLNQELAQTYEDATITSPTEREIAFGQSDHVRVYGRDYLNRLISAGFRVHIDDFVKQLTEEEVTRFGLMREEDLYVCAK